MSVIRVHLEAAEMHVVTRLARALSVTNEDVVYAALDRLMAKSRDSEIQLYIRNNSSTRKQNLPRWADTARSVHAYEGGHDDHPEERFQFD